MQYPKIFIVCDHSLTQVLHFYEKQKQQKYGIHFLPIFLGFFSNQTEDKTMKQEFKDSEISLLFVTLV